MLTWLSDLAWMPMFRASNSFGYRGTKRKKLSPAVLL